MADFTSTPYDADWPAPNLNYLVDERPPAPALPLEALCGPKIANWIRATAESKGAPVDYVFAALIAAAGAILSSSRLGSPWEGWKEPPLVWAMCIGLPSSGKSPAIDAVLAPLRAVERDLRKAAQKPINEWNEKSEVAKAKEAKWKKQLREAIDNGEPAPAKPTDIDLGPKPTAPRLAVADATTEKLCEILASQILGLVQARDELSGWLENMTRYNGGASDRPFWLEAFGGRSYSVDRLSRGSLTIDRLCIGVVGGIQPDRLRTILLDSDDDGLVARFIPFWPEPAPITRPTRTGDDEVIKEVLRNLVNLTTGGASVGRHEPWTSTFTEEARKGMDAFRVTMREREREAEGLMLSFIGKLPGLAVRLATVFLHLDLASGDALNRVEIGSDYFSRARLFIDSYALPMANRVYVGVSRPKAERAARRLLTLLKEEKIATFKTRDITRRELRGLSNSTDMKAATELLLDAGWLRSTDVASTTRGGRPTVIYRAHPQLFAG